VRDSAEHARLVEAKSAVILDTAPVAMIMSNTEGVITYYNPQAEYVFGWSPEEVLGKPVHFLLAPATADLHSGRFDEAVKRIRGQEGAWQFTRRVTGHAVTKAGEELHVRVAVRAIKYNGYVEFVAVISPVDCPLDDEVEMRPFVPSEAGNSQSFQPGALKEH